MIGTCQKCSVVGIEVQKITVLFSEIGTAQITLCQNCRKNR